MCQAKTTELGRLKVKVNKLTRDRDALQSDVDKIITSGINTVEHGNRTRTDDTGINTREFITQVKEELAAMEEQKIEIENMVISVRNGLKQEKAWQHEAISNVTEFCHDIQSGVTTETRDLKQENHDMHENIAESKQRLSNVELENRAFRSMIVGMQKDKKKMQADIENIQAENKVMKDVIRDVKTELVMLKSKLLETTLTEPSSTTTSTTTKPPTRPDTCDDGWQRFNGHCYLFVDQWKTWDDALSYCEARSSYLLEITSDTEYEFVGTELVRLLRKYGFYWYWTGGTDRRSFLYHHSGEPVPNKYWAPGEPNNASGNQHCVYIFYSISEYTGLYDGSCSNSGRFVCEKS